MRQRSFGGHSLAVCVAFTHWAYSGAVRPLESASHSLSSGTGNHARSFAGRDASRSLQVTSSVALRSLTEPSRANNTSAGRLASNKAASSVAALKIQSDAGKTAASQPLDSGPSSQEEASAPSPSEASSVVVAPAPSNVQDGASGQEHARGISEIQGKMKDDVEESVRDLDKNIVINKIPALAEFQAALVKSFTEDEGTYCLAPEGDDHKYGCGWMPKIRNSMSVKDKSQPACGCQVTWMFQQCWQPDIDVFLKVYEQGNVKSATQVAKAYIAGRCYTPIWAYGIIIGLVVLFACCGGWRIRKAGTMDARLAGSSVDPSRNLEN